jgi:hypothetical protein
LRNAVEFCNICVADLTKYDIMISDNGQRSTPLFVSMLTNKFYFAEIEQYKEEKA